VRGTGLTRSPRRGTTKARAIIGRCRPGTADSQQVAAMAVAARRAAVQLRWHGEACGEGPMGMREFWEAHCALDSGTKGLE
jgi:hypothetical protein